MEHTPLELACYGRRDCLIRAGRTTTRCRTSTRSAYEAAPPPTPHSPGRAVPLAAAG